MSEQENTNLVQEVYERFRKGDESFLESFSDDITFELPEMENVPYAGTHNGIQAVKEFFALLAEVEENLAHNPTDFIANGDKVVVLGNYKWRVKATNKEYDGDFCHVMTLRDGKIASFKEFIDTAVRINAHTAARAV